MSDYELKRINALPEASAINDSDVFAIDSAAGTKKVAWETLKGEVDADITEAVSNKADKDGTYPDMAVGSVLGTRTVTDREPYFIRPSASIGDREFDTLVGGSLGWNQLANQPSAFTKTFSSDTSEYYGSLGTLATSIDVISGHKYFCGANVERTISQNNGVSITFADIAGAPFVTVANGSSNGWHYTVLNAANNKNGAILGYNNYLGKYGFNAGDSITVNNSMFIDLTIEFGSTIADYIYSLEQAHAGDGVAWVRKYLPNDYYAYCAPTLKHVSGVSAHVMRDANNNIIGNYPIDSTWTGMGIPKLDSDGKLYFDGDRYASDGTVTERFGIVDLGEKTWMYASDVNAFYAGGLPIILTGYTNGTCAPMICGKYVTVPYFTAPNSYMDGHDKSVAFAVAAGQRLWIRDTSFGTDAVSFKASLSGQYLVYELETPTTSSASPFTSPQICDPNGTEEYVTTGLVPVGHETEYVENLADKLTDIPDLPTTAGNYHLAVTVDGGTPSYAWVADE